jgi:hypothetical protein
LQEQRRAKAGFRVIRKIIQCSDKNYLISRCLCRGGFGYLKKMINGFNNAAKTAPVLVLTDLDMSECPPTLIQNWLKVRKHHNPPYNIK